MRVLVLSDSHGCVQRLRRVLETEAECPVVFFLGDGLSDLGRVQDAFPARRFVAVCGNCDWQSDAPSAETFAYQYVDGHTILATHGHCVSVRRTLRVLAEKAKGVRADLALYGHTHRAAADTCEGVLCVNPGALCDGRYAVLTLTKQETDVSFCRCAF